MTNSITMNLHRCFSKLTSCSSPQVAPKKSQDHNSLPSSSYQSPASSTVVFKNFNSLYDPAAAAASDSDTLAASHSATFTATTATATATGAATDSDNSAATITDADSFSSDPDLSSAIASRRLLPPTSPSLSNVIADPSAVAFGIGVAVPTYSPDPYGDFRRSMEEMAAAMGLMDPSGGRCRREHLYELLLCYLALNRKHSHKYIVGAFADLLAGLSDDDGGEQGGG